MKAYHERDQRLPQERPENRDAENGEENAEESPIKEIHELLKKEEIHLIREKGSLEANLLYCEMCYPTMVGNQRWKIQHVTRMLRTLVTEADEALAAVILENNFQEWDQLARGIELDKENRMTKYTYGANSTGGTTKGWSLEGKERFNEMFDAIEKLRKDKIHGEKLEKGLIRIWKQKGIGKKRKRSEVDGEDVEAEMRRKKNEESYEPRFSAF